MHLCWIYYWFLEEQCRWLVCCSWSLGEGIPQLCGAPWREGCTHMIIEFFLCFARGFLLNQHLAVEVSLLLFCTPRIILSCEGGWTSSAQFTRQWAAVRKMLLPIWERKKFCKRKSFFNQPVLQHICYSLLWSPPHWAKDPAMDVQRPCKRLWNIKLSTFNSHINQNDTTSASSPPTILAAELTPHWQPWLHETAERGKAVTARPMVELDFRRDGWTAQDSEFTS